MDVSTGTSDYDIYLNFKFKTEDVNFKRHGFTSLKSLISCILGNVRSRAWLRLQRLKVRSLLFQISFSFFPLSFTQLYASAILNHWSASCSSEFICCVKLSLVFSHCFFLHLILHSVRACKHRDQLKSKVKFAVHQNRQIRQMKRIWFQSVSNLIHDSNILTCVCVSVCVCVCVQPGPHG